MRALHCTPNLRIRGANAFDRRQHVGGARCEIDLGERDEHDDAAAARVRELGEQPVAPTRQSARGEVVEVR